MYNDATRRYYTHVIISRAEWKQSKRHTQVGSSSVWYILHPEKNCFYFVFLFIFRGKKEEEEKNGRARHHTQEREREREAKISQLLSSLVCMAQ